MAEKKAAKESTKKSAKSTIGKASRGFTDEERTAMRERAQELKAAARRGPRAGKADGESEMLAKIAEMPEPDRAMAERLHAIIKASAPALSPRTWYGMPAYAKDGNVVCFFQSAQKFKNEVRDVRLQRQSKPRRRRYVADGLRAEDVDRRRRGKDRRAREESGELRTELDGGGNVDVTPEQRTYARLAGIMYLLNYGLQTVWDGLTLWGRGSASFAETARWAVEPDALYRVALVHVAVGPSRGCNRHPGVRVSAAWQRDQPHRSSLAKRLVANGRAA